MTIIWISPANSKLEYVHTIVLKMNPAYSEAVGRA